MFRLALSRSAGIARAVSHVRAPVVSPRIALGLRHESTISDERKKVLEARDKLQGDWDAKEITYEELKPKTQQPSAVRFPVHLDYTTFSLWSYRTSI